MRQYIIYSQISRKPMIQLVLYNIFKEMGTHGTIVRLIKLCLNEMCSKIFIGKHLSNNFPV
jgi:hypothetical protein